MRDAEGARLATIELLEIAARDLDNKLIGAKEDLSGLCEAPVTPR
jgi:hypothetical protein